MDPFLGEIIMFGGNFAPRGWALCDGQLLPISQYSALFSILGTTYGGDGRTTFGLPDLRGRVPVHAGNGPGLSDRRLGGKGGTETNTLTTGQLPSHTHNQMASSNGPDVKSPTGAFLPTIGRSGEETYASAAGTATPMGGAIGHTGSNQAVNNVQPFQCVNFIIALQGVFPSRS